MDIATATRRYEAWMARQTPLIADDLALKHKRMAAAPFAFLRGTFYRWAQLWPLVCPSLAAAPKLLAVGDLHVENFGTWRDAEARLVWGINDFDEAAIMPYTIDLVRLATSAILAAQEHALAIAPATACAAILEGYRGGIMGEGAVFVLDREHGWLRKLALNERRDPAKFWAKLDALPDCRPAPPRPVLRWLTAALPAPTIPFRVVHRVAGVGSLGRARYLALGEWHGGGVARETKVLTRSAYGWARGDGAAPIQCQRLLRQAIRCPDPSVELHGAWLLRRLAPDCSRIDLASLPAQRDEGRLLRAMGQEVANVHLGSANAGAVREDISRRKPGFLVVAATAMAKAAISDWKAWRR